MSKYANRTEVSVAKSKAEIETVLTKYGADQFISGWADDTAVVAFRMNERHIKMQLPLPDRKDPDITHYKRGYSLVERSVDAQANRYEQACRARWRALLLVIKAKLEAIETGISVFDDEFMPHIVMPDGRTVSEHIRPAITNAYETGDMPPLLPHFGGGA